MTTRTPLIKRVWVVRVTDRIAAFDAQQTEEFSTWIPILDSSMCTSDLGAGRRIGHGGGGWGGAALPPSWRYPSRGAMCRKGGGGVIGRTRSWSSKDSSGFPRPPQNSAEPLGFCRKVLQEVSHSKACWREVLRNPEDSAELGSQAQLFRPCKFFSHFYTVVAEMITELIRFEPEICICNGN